jgi:WD40 repeat protein
MRPLHGHQDFVLCVGFSADGRWLASGGADNRLFLPVSTWERRQRRHAEDDALAS